MTNVTPHSLVPHHRGLASRLFAGACCLALTLALAGKVAAEEEPGLPMLDKALQLKLDATRMSDLDKVVQLCEQSLEEGMSDANQAFAREFMAATLYEKAERLSQTVAQGPTNLAWLQRRQLAINTIDKSIKVNPKQPEAYLLKAGLHELAGAAERSEGLAAAVKAVGLLTDNPARRGAAFVAQASFTTDPEEQVELLSRALVDAPANQDALKSRGAAYVALKQWDKALDDFRAILQQDTRNIQSLQSLVQVLVAQDKIDEALTTVTESIAAEPDEPGMYTLRSGIYLVQEEFDLAQADLDRALELNPRSVASLLARARMFAMKQDYNEAMADATRALELEPGLVQALFVRCEIALSAGNYQRAISDLRQLLRQAPNDVGLRMQLASVYLAAEEPQMAISVYEQVLRDDPKEWSALQGRADARLNLGEHALAIKDYDRVLEAQPDVESVLNNLAWVLATSTFDELRDGKRAIELALRACEATEYKAPHILSTLAAGYAEVGDFEKALEWSTKAVELGEGDMKEQLAKELESYRQQKPWRERQLQAAVPGSLAADLGVPAESSETEKPADPPKPESSEQPESSETPDAPNDSPKLEAGSAG